MAAQKEMIRIRLKAYDHQLIDQSAEKIAEAVNHVREVYLAKGGRLDGKGVLPC